MPKTNKLFSEYIEIKGARVHNLKNIEIKIKRDRLIVITGLSGSGKSTLAFDTIYAEGQRRYVESLSSYARQFLGRLNKPEVDYIKGIPPAIAVEQKVNTRNPRSTVGTSTEIYDYLKLLYARAGETYSPVSGLKVKRHTVTDVVNFLLKYPENTKILILCKIQKNSKRTNKEQLQVLQKQGFSRVEFDKKIKKIDVILKQTKLDIPEQINLVIDRLVVSDDNDTVSRIADSVQTAFFEGKGICAVKIFNGTETIQQPFSNKFEADGIIFETPSVNTFSFNNPLGACPLCKGFGKALGIDEDLVVPNKKLSIYQEAVACWRGEKMSLYKNEFIKKAHKFNFPIHRPYQELNKEHKKQLWYGNKYFSGLYDFFKTIESQKKKIQYRIMLARYKGKTICPECNGTRLKKEANYIKFNGKSICELVDLPLNKLKFFFENTQISDYQLDISKRLLEEILNRLQYLLDVGLGYLTLNRLSSSLSGGESQRINLTSSLGSSLVGALYILDEPSIGLHSKDTKLLIKILKQLRDLGNTVIVVEHDDDIIRAADELIDLGTFAGNLGGEIVFHGSFQELIKNTIKNKKSLTADYITGRRKIKIPTKRRKSNRSIEIIGAKENNLKNIDVKFPLDVLTVVTGVSGSGKSSLVRGILYPVLSKKILGFGKKIGNYSKLNGDFKDIEAIEFIDQNPIGKSSRSNSITYLKAFDDIRKLFASEQLSKIYGFKTSHFSFNVDGGRCDACKGEGEIKIEMQFMADVFLVCDSCDGKRFKDAVLEVKYKDKNIYDILNMTVDEAFDFFNNDHRTKKIANKIKPLVDVGLGYIKTGQSSNTLSGGESQRIKLAYFLSKEHKCKKTLFIFDEPTTGLHFHDIKKLLLAFDALISQGHSIIIIEHNLEIIKSADRIIDLGAEGGDKGGYLIFEGTPEGLIKCKESYTGKYLKKKFDN